MSIEQALAEQEVTLFDNWHSPGIIAIAAIALAIIAATILLLFSKKDGSLRKVGAGLVWGSVLTTIAAILTFTSKYDDEVPKIEEAWPAVEEALQKKYTIAGASPASERDTALRSGVLHDESLLWMEDLIASHKNAGHSGPKTVVITEDGDRYTYRVSVYGNEAELLLDDGNSNATPDPEVLLREMQE